MLVERRGGDALYCQRMPCVERELTRLHDLCTVACDMRPQSIDRYLYLCALLDTTGAERVIQRDSPTTDVRRVTVRCLCGDPRHTVVLDKQRVNGPCFPFDISHLNKSKSIAVRAGGRWVSVKKGRCGALVPANFLVPTEGDTLQFDALPDLGMYIRCLLVRRYYSSVPVKHFRKCSRLLLGGQEVETQPTADGRKLSPIAFAERFVDGFCCMLLQESIPCMKRAKRSIKATEFHVTPTAVEVWLCPLCLLRPACGGVCN